MTRPEAMTVSCTEVELDETHVQMTYRARVGDGSNELGASPIIIPVLAMP
jgi:hypothetical protein